MNHPQRLPLGGTFPFEPGEKPTLFKLVKSFLEAASIRTAGAKDIRYILVDVPLNPDMTKRLLPRGIKLDQSSPGRIFIASYGQAIYSPPYNEAALLIPVKPPLSKGISFSWIVVDQDLALIYGRSGIACPKKLADISLQENGDSVSARVTRRGIPLITIEAQRRAPEKDPGFILGARTFNPGGLGQLLFLNLVWSFQLKETILESYTAEGTLVLEDSPYDPIKPLVADFHNPLPMRLVKMDLVGSSIPLPVWFAGVRWYINSYNLRFA